MSGVRIRRAESEDVGFLLDLVSHEEVEPFLGALSASRDALAAEVERSRAEPHDFGRFVIEADGVRVGAMGFEVANRRSRIAHLERLAVHPDHRGRRLADTAARLLQDHLFRDLGYHRLQLEVYGFNERAIAHSERVGFLREGVKRRAYWRHGRWVDGVLYALLADEVELADSIRLLHDHVGRFNEGVRTGDFAPMLESFSTDAELAFEGVPVGPFHGRDAIAAAYRERPPDDQLDVLEAWAEDGVAIGRYAWRAAPATVAGRMLLTADRVDAIKRLVVTFESS